jgi:glycine cleavage system H protein
MFIGFVLLDFIVQRLQARRATVSAVTGHPWNVPWGYYLAEEHTWCLPASAMGVKVGADALIAHALGAVQKVVLPKQGELVKAGEPLFELECNGQDLKIPSSITGQVVALNSRLRKHPELVAKDPYGSGWICAITPTLSNGGSGGTRSGEKATAWLEQEFHRFREFLSLQVSPDPVLSVSYPDGGLPAVGSLTHLGSGGWRAFEAEFLRPHRGAINR